MALVAMQQEQTILYDKRGQVSYAQIWQKCPNMAKMLYTSPDPLFTTYNPYT